MLTAEKRSSVQFNQLGRSPRAVVLWIDWYPYHVARFQALWRHPGLHGSITGIEMVGGTGVHVGLKFREEIPGELPVTTLFPQGSWAQVGKLKLARAVWLELSRQNPSSVLVPGYYNLPAIAAALWSRVKGRRSILMTESTEEDHSRVWWKEFGKRILLKLLFSHAIAGGTAHRRYLSRLGFPIKRTARFYDVVDNHFFWNRAQADRVRFRAHELSLPERYFLFVGRLAEEKNVRRLLEAYLNYRRDGGSWSLVLVGGGPGETELKQIASSSPFSKDIHFEGLRTSNELPPYYAFAGCFILPSFREPWGLVVNEAMASGLPVVVSSACGCAEDLVEHGQNGFVFDPKSTDAISSCLRKMETLSAAERSAMANRSSEIISGFSPEAWANEVDSLAASK